jgi:N-acetylglucosaminyldiphosphoundecaprenol N-acetyl-beta-D-mannosaminyltransferase
MNRPAKRSVVGVPVSPTGIGNVAQFLGSRPAGHSTIVTFVNPHACFLGKKYPDYLRLLEEFDVVSCDGIGMILACHLSGLPDIRREAFDLTSLAPPVLHWAATRGKSVVLVGGKQGVAQQAAEILQRIVPRLRIDASFPGFGTGPSAALDHCNKWQTELVICGMGAPLQERFLARLVGTGWKGAAFTCGGFLDQTAEGGEYFPDWADRLNVRFLYRLAREPRRLWRRYLIEYQVFTGRFLGLVWRRLFRAVRPPGPGEGGR